MIGGYEDDAHICLKCHLTIIGLENYVNHRKRNCLKTLNVVEIPKSPLPSQLLPQEESFNLKADDFFSSLELQSSSKKTPVPSTSGKTVSGILTRSKTSAVIQSNNTVKEIVPDIQQSKSGKNAWIGGHQLKELGCGDNQTKLIKAVDNLSRSSCLKKDDTPDIRVYNETDDDSDDYDFEDDEYDEGGDIPPRSFTGGKWKPGSPISDWNEPPPNYTGGKWKPPKQTRMLLCPPQNHTKGKWTPESSIQNLKEPYDTIPSPSFTGSKWTASKAKNEYGDVPPPSHTKGKWKPTNFKEKLGQSSRWEGGDSGDQFPPQGHTKGKWKPVANEKKPPEEKLDDKLNIKYEDRRKISEDSPPFRKYNGSVQYWCGPCNRRLASKIVYDRHLKSKLHFKRTLHDAEFDDSSHLNTNLDKETKKTTIRKPVEYWSHTTTENNKDTMKNTTQTAKRIRKNKYVKCEVCKSRVTSQMMGKHLISHYHCRKGDISLPGAKKMVLDNIYNIVLQSPYQCAICRFYCSTHEHFLDHWNTPQHKENVINRPGYIWCGFCKFSCTDNDLMHEHLISPEHSELISVINRSVPIIIKKMNPIKCDSCSKSFILNIQLRKHCEKENHKCSGTASDEYQTKNSCSMCDKIYSSTIALQRHIKKHHNKNMFFCSLCNVKFENSEDIVSHRNGEEHRSKYSEKTKKNSETCDYCELSFKKFSMYKKHLQEAHPERTHSCPHCGKKFTVPQDVTVHIRTKSCSFVQEKKDNSCDRCPYSTESVSDLIYHKALHATPVLMTSEKSSKQQQNYKCPLCHKFYSKHSLKYHIKNHMNEKSYECTYCDVKFARKNNWKVHLKKHITGKLKTKPKIPTDQMYECEICKASFKQKSILNNHMLIHNGKKFKCSSTNCFHAARSEAELKIHEKTHSDEKSYKCKSCDYSGKTKPLLRRHELIHNNEKKYKCSKCNFTARLAFNLKRHELVHTGAKPYICPHCEYKCNTIENLRKHVLSTNKHPGKCLYECKFCEEDQFQTNFAKDFRVHLIAEHRGVFRSGSEATSYIAGIYDSADVNITSKQTETIGSKVNSSIMPLVLTETATDSNMDNNVLITTQPSYSNKGEDLFPMYMTSKDEVTCVDKDTWSMVASFDVEESAALVTFNGEEEAFFEEDFIDP